MSIKLSSFVFMSFLLGLTASASANDELYRPLPSVSFTIETSFDTQLRDGPLFQKTVEVLRKVSSGKVSENVLGDAMARVSYSLEQGLQSIPVTADFLEAISASCHQPISFHEEAEWVQLSWACRNDSESEISNYLTFQNSPELNFTAWYEHGQIFRVRVGEVIPVPGQRLMRMDAYSLLEDDR